MVSVIVVNWNGEKFIERCLSALHKQTLKPLEIIVVDNASSDLSVEIIRRFSSVRLLALSENVGFARANNIATEATSPGSHWVALLNPDAFPEPTWLEELLSAASSFPAFEVFASKLVTDSAPEILDGAGDAYNISGLPWRVCHGEQQNSFSNMRHEVFSPCGAAALYKLHAFITVGGFDEDFFCYIEDIDLGFRLRLAKYRCLYVPTSVVRHVGSGTTGGRQSGFALYHGHRNVVWTFVKDMPGILFWLFLPLHIAMNFFSIMWFAFQGKGSVILKAKRDALLGLPRAWRKRRIIQKSRVASVGDIWKHLDKSLLPARVLRKII